MTAGPIRVNLLRARSTNTSQANLKKFIWSTILRSVLLQHSVRNIHSTRTQHRRNRAEATERQGSVSPGRAEKKSFIEIGSKRRGILMLTERTTDSPTIAHERLASIAQFFCALVKSRVFVRESGMHGLIQIHLGAGKQQTPMRGGYSGRVNEGGDII